MGTDPSRYLEQRPAQLHELRWHHRHWFIMRGLRRSLQRQVDALHLAPGCKVLDYGCATQPYRNLFAADAQYVGADLPGNALAQVHINPDGTLPVADGEFDLVLSTQVLEHIPDPAAYVRECLRVLKPGGHLILTTHGIWIYHRDPVDYWRWTADGLRFLAQNQGFAIAAVEGIMGLTAVSVQLFQDATWHHLPRFLRTAYGFLMQRLVAAFDLLHSPASRVDNAMVYVIVARK